MRVEVTDCSALLETGWNATELGWFNTTVNGNFWCCLNVSGIVCDRDLRITSLILAGLFVQGYLPDSLQRLSRLRHVDLHDNAFSGNISIAQSWFQLEYLDLSNANQYDRGSNCFGGSLQPLQNLKQLQHLDLSNNNFEYYATNGNHFWGDLLPLANLTMMKYLSISFSFKSTTLTPLLRLTRLEYLDLDSSNIEGSLEPLRHLTQLSILDLSSNALSGTVEPLCNLTRLIFLNLWSNRLYGTLETLENVTSLERLYVGANQLNGTLEVVTSMPLLRSCCVQDNHFTGAVDALTHHSLLVDLYLHDNFFTGTLDVALMGRKTSLSQLYIHRNQFCGSLDSVNIVNTPAMENLDISDNNFSGSLASVLKIPSIGYVNVANNAMFGELGDELSPLSSLNKMVLDNNSFCGDLSFLSQSTQLTFFSASDNLFESTLMVFSKLTHMQHLSLVNNRIFGGLSPLVDLQQLQFLNLANNSICCELDSLLKLTLLLHLTLSNNIIDGSLDTLAGLTQLLTLDLSHNKLNGTILPLLNQTNLEVLKLNGNTLVGTVFNTIATLNGIKIVDLSDNPFNDTIDQFDFFQSLPHLVRINLSRTSMIGQTVSIPWSKYPNLIEIDVSNNAFFRGSTLAVETFDGQSGFFWSNNTIFQCPLPAFPSSIITVMSPCHQSTSLIVALCVLGVVLVATNALIRKSKLATRDSLIQVIGIGSWVVTVLSFANEINLLLKIVWTTTQWVKCDNINQRLYFESFLPFPDYIDSSMGKLYFGPKGPLFTPCNSSLIPAFAIYADACIGDWSQTPPSPQQSFAEYMDIYKLWAAMEYKVGYNIYIDDATDTTGKQLRAFDVLCAQHPRCRLEYSVLCSNRFAKRWSNAPHYGILLFAVVMLCYKFLLELCKVVTIVVTEFKLWPTATGVYSVSFIKSSPFLPIICCVGTRHVLNDVLLIPSSYQDHMRSFVWNVLLNQLPTCVLTTLFYLNVVQTGFSTLNYISFVRTVSMTLMMSIETWISLRASSAESPSDDARAVKGVNQQQEQLLPSNIV
jgi:Leucine-rich repeat (LRR) protein